MAKEPSKKDNRPKGKDTKTRKDDTKSRKGKGSGMKYIVSIIIIVLIIGVAIFASSFLNTPGTGNNSFSVFEKNYDSAPRVNIFVAAYNGTVLSSTIGCATAVIEQLIASRANHRDAGTIDLNIINETSCIRSVGLGNTSRNYTVTSLQNCLNTSSTEPSLYINYSMTNVTIIKPEYMYISGSALFLRECGLASEFS